MRILKRILLAIMVMCLCASVGISLAFAEGESTIQLYEMLWQSQQFIFHFSLSAELR